MGSIQINDLDEFCKYHFEEPDGFQTCPGVEAADKHQAYSRKCEKCFYYIRRRAAITTEEYIDYLNGDKERWWNEDGNN